MLIHIILFNATMVFEKYFFYFQKKIIYELEQEKWFHPPIFYPECCVLSTYIHCKRWSVAGWHNLRVF